jgi:hypothetical protein
LDDKERRIRELQEAIMDKKEQNDAIQEAFIKRKECSNFFAKEEFPEVKLKIIGEGCNRIAVYHSTLKRNLFKSLLIYFKHSKTSRPKAVKAMLMWVIGILSKMFSFLSGLPIQN